MAEICKVKDRKTGGIAFSMMIDLDGMFTIELELLLLMM